MTSFRIQSPLNSRKLCAVVVATLILGGSGCSSLELINWKGADKLPTADAQHPAIEVLAIWQAAEGPGLGGVPTRGFAGQIFFFAEDRAQPVAVDGKARIYVFDDHGPPEQQTRPLRQFDFDRQSWAAHMQHSKLGPTYGVFIPYPRDDFHQAVCSLRVRFTPPKGRSLYSTSSTIVLPGPPLPADAAQNSPFDKLAAKLKTNPQLANPWSNPSAVAQAGMAAAPPQAAQQITAQQVANPQIANAQMANPQMAAPQLAAQQMLTQQMQQMPTQQMQQMPAQQMPTQQMPQQQIAVQQQPTAFGASSTDPSPLGRYATARPIQGFTANPVVQTSATMSDPNASPSANSMVYPAAYSEVGSPGAAQPSARVRLQAVNNAAWQSDADDAGSRSAGPAVVHPNHPLAD